MKPRTTIALLIAAVGVLAGLNVWQYIAASPPAPPPQPIADAEVVDRFQRLFVDSRQLFSSKWFGVQTLQHPFDVWVTQEIIWEVAPDVIVETGTLEGGSAVLWATILEHANPEGRVVTVDIEDLRSPEAKALPIYQKRVDFLLGGSTDPNVVGDVAKRVKGKRTMVILDSLHTKDHVLAELEAYSPLVSVDSYLIVQDTHLGDTIPFWYRAQKNRWAPGPRAAVEAFLAGTDAFEIDRSRERLLATNNRGGFLRRVR